MYIATCVCNTNGSYIATYHIYLSDNQMPKDIVHAPKYFVFPLCLHASCVSWQELCGIILGILIADAILELFHNNLGIIENN